MQQVVYYESIKRELNENKLSFFLSFFESEVFYNINLKGAVGLITVKDIGYVRITIPLDL